MPLSKAWEMVPEGDAGPFADVPGTLGVYEICDEAGAVIYIGKADPRIPFGLKQAIRQQFEAGRHGGRARGFRYELTSNYYSRWIDLLTRFNEDYGRIPDGNVPEADTMPRLGRFHWKSPAAEQA